MTTHPPVIELQELTKRFGDLVALAVSRPPDRRTPLLTLREHARAIVERLARGQTPLGPDLEAINQILGHPTGQLTLVDGDSAQPSICFQAHRDDGAGVAFRVALSLAQFLVAGARRRLKLCANPGCGYAFLDTSNNGSRRWCDMRACGNRQKVRTFRRRRHAARPASTPDGLSPEQSPSRKV